LSNIKPTDEHKILYELLASLNSPDEIAILLRDLCTVKEIDQMDQRIRSAKLLMDGKTYIQVCEETGISTVTLSRVSRALQHGSGGYSRLLRDYILSTKENNS
jgi:TrpR-related protein YerC/YecD